MIHQNGAVPSLSQLEPEILAEFAVRFPKIELHQHLEGSFTAEDLWEVAKAHKLDIPYTSLHELAGQVELTEPTPSLEAFLEKFPEISRFFVSLAVLEDLTARVVERAARDGVLHVELRFSPAYIAQPHNLPVRDVTQAIVESAERSARENDITCSTTLIIERQLGTALGEHIVELARDFHDAGVKAIDLANDEANFPPQPYAPLFREARQHGLHRTVHAGEAAGPENIWSAVRDLGAERVGHGVRAVEDPELLAFLREERIPLEVCLSSNIHTGVFSSLQQHSFPHLLESGVFLTLNTDDPGISRISLSTEVVAAVSAFDLSLDGLRACQENALSFAFLDDGEREILAERFQEKAQHAEDWLLAKLSPNASADDQE